MATNIDYSRVANSVDRMIAANKPPEFIRGFIDSEGATLDGLRSFRAAPTQAAPSVPTTPAPSDTKQVIAGKDPSLSSQTALTAAPPKPEVNPPPAPGFIETFGQDFQKRQNIVDETKAARGRGEMGGITAITTPIGQAAGYGMDVLENVAGAVIHPKVKELASAAGKAISDRPTRGDATFGDVGKSAIKAGKAAFGALERKSPTTGRVIRDLTNVGMLTGPVKGKKVPTGGVSKGKVGQVADIIATGKRRDSGIRDMVKKTGKKADEAAVDYTEVKGKGPFKRKVTESSPYMKSVEDAVINIPGVSPRKGPTQNYKLIQDVVNKERAAIEKALDGSKGIIPKNEVSGLTKKASDRALSDPIFKGESTSATVAQGMVDEFGKILAKHPGTARGLHDARVEFDKTMKGFNPNINNPMVANNVKKIVNKAIRDEVNDTIDRVAPKSGYKAYRDKSSKLLTAMGNMKPKAAKETMGIMKSIEDILKPSGVPYAAPVVRAGAKLTHATLVGALDAIEAGLKTITDPTALKQLRADKIALSEFADNFEEDTNGQEQGE